MLLKDATNQAAVDLFLRNLDFSFPTRDVVGIPGNIVGLTAPHEEEQAVILLHELEHIYALTHPLGTLFSALGLRALDLRNALATRYIDLNNKTASLADAEDAPHALEIEAALVAIDAGDLAEFARRINMTVQLMLPLLEGLAMISELEVVQPQGSWSWLTIAALEFLYYEHRIVLSRPDLLAALNDDQERKLFAENLFNSLERQLAWSREERLKGDLVDTMFFEQREAGDSLSGPYFYGYLYLRRLHQEWATRMPELEFDAFFPIATKLICSVFPLTLLPLYSLKDLPRASDQLPVVFADILTGVFSLSRSQIEFLRDSDQLLTWRFSENKLEAIPEQQGATATAEPPDREARVFGEIVWSVFDLRLAQESTWETFKVLQDMERAKFLLRTGVRKVIVFAVDEEQKTALIGEPSRAQWNDEKTRPVSFGASGATFFRFQDSDVFDQFLKIADGPAGKLLRLKLGDAPYKFGGARHLLAAELQTFCFLWPYGVPGERNGELANFSPAEIVRVLICGNEPQARRAFVHGPPIRDLASLIRTRDWINRNLLEGIRKSLDEDYPESLHLTAIIKSMYGPKSPATIAAEEVLRRFVSGDLPEIRPTCWSVYSTVLFPASTPQDQPELSARKFDAVVKLLPETDKILLRRWMHGGLVLHPARAWTAGQKLTPGASSSVENIRKVAIGKLGIPLLRWNEDGLKVELDLIPASA